MKKLYFTENERIERTENWENEIDGQLEFFSSDAKVGTGVSAKPEPEIRWPDSGQVQVF